MAVGGREVRYYKGRDRSNFPGVKQGIRAGSVIVQGQRGPTGERQRDRKGEQMAGRQACSETGMQGSRQGRMRQAKHST